MEQEDLTIAEKEYIERNTAIEALTTDFWEHYSDCHSSSDVSVFEAMRDSISEIPAADVVEVVRCKDCGHAYINSFSAQSGIAVCRFLANRSNGELAIVQQDDFCSYGERKEQE